MPGFFSFDHHVCELLFVLLGFVQTVMSFVTHHVLLFFYSLVFSVLFVLFVYGLWLNLFHHVCLICCYVFLV